MFVGLASGPTRPLLLMISGRAYIRTVNQNIILTIGPTALSGDLEFFPSCCLTVYKIFFSKIFFFQEIIHLGKESKTTVCQTTNGISTKKRKIVFPLYKLCEVQYIILFNQTVFLIYFHLRS